MLNKNIFLVKIKNNIGGHMDVYVDFEEEIIKLTNWIHIDEAGRIAKAIFRRSFFYMFVKRNFFKLNLPILNKNKAFFTIISGTEYEKLYIKYAFKSKLKAIYIFDAWPIDNHLNENAIRSFGINVAFMSASNAVKHFNEVGFPDFKAYWIPEAVDSSRFMFYDYQQKTIDLLQYGRRWEWYHNKIHNYCEENQINYQFPKDRFKTQFKSREDLVDALALTKIAICVPRAITHPELYNDQSTLTTRYFECMSSKCLILGKAPDELITVFGYNPVIEVDENNVEEQLQDILNNYDSYRELIEKNFQNTIKNHQWHNRIIEIESKMDFHVSQIKK